MGEGTYGHCLGCAVPGKGLYGQEGWQAILLLTTILLPALLYYDAVLCATVFSLYFTRFLSFDTIAVNPDIESVVIVILTFPFKITGAASF